MMGQKSLMGSGSNGSGVNGSGVNDGSDQPMMGQINQMMGHKT